MRDTENSRFKFRVWDNKDYMSNPFTLKDLQEGKISFTSDCRVMQFTGLLDKNGKEIYEGDIVTTWIVTSVAEWEHEETLTVVFKIGSYCLENTQRSLMLHDKCLRNEIPKGLPSDKLWQCEVIGNIYQNPELLTKIENK